MSITFSSCFYVIKSKFDHDGHTKTLALTSHDEEVCETISRLTLQHNLQIRPIVITGLLCVGMGQTLTHKLLGSFTSAIFGHLDLINDEIYQLFGRITGRIKDWDKYIQTQVYCPTIIMNRCIIMEECARRMANEHNGDVVSQEDYRKPMTELGEVGQSAIDNIRIQKKKKQIIPKKDDDDKQHKVFETQTEAITFGRTLGAKLNKRTTNSAPKELQTDGKKSIK